MHCRNSRFTVSLRTARMLSFLVLQLKQIKPFFLFLSSSFSIFLIFSPSPPHVKFMLLRADIFRLADESVTTWSQLKRQLRTQEQLFLHFRTHENILEFFFLTIFVIISTTIYTKIKICWQWIQYNQNCCCDFAEQCNFNVWFLSSSIFKLQNKTLSISTNLFHRASKCWFCALSTAPKRD